MMPKLEALALGLVACHTAIAASSTDWRSRSIYQILTDRFARTDGSTTATCDTEDRVYCGGSWQGITNKLDYIQGMGFDAVWISPITYQLQGNTPYGYAYHGYWQQNLYELNSNFGTAADLKALSSALHSRGMYLMVDVVTNHFGYDGSPSSVNYDIFNPFNSESYFHPYCPNNYDPSNLTNLQQCWEGDTNVSLPDLRTEDSDVANAFNSWISGLISTYSIDGLRIDSVLEVNTGFWSSFQNAAGVYSVGEVDNGDASLVCSYQDYLPGVLNYGTYFPLVAAFQSTSGSISNYANTINTVKSDCADTSLLGSFSENHDQPRFASLTQDFSLAKNVIAGTVLADGIPIVYEGQEQHYASLGGSGDPYNREAIWFSGYNTSAPLYEHVATLNTVRKQAIAQDSGYLTYRNYPIYTDTTTIAMRKGNMVSVLSNKGAQGAAYSQAIPAGYAAGTQVTEVLTCATLTADGSGDITVPMANGLPRIYYPTAGLAGSGLCGTGENAEMGMRPGRKVPGKPTVTTRRREKYRGTA